MFRGLFFVGVLSIFGSLSEARASFELTESVYLQGCPFMHDDAYDFTSLLGELKTQIQTKVDGKTQCAAALAPVYEQFNAYQTYLDTLDVSARQTIAADALANYLSGLNARRAQLEIGGVDPATEASEYATLGASVSAVESQILSNDIELAYGKDFKRDTQEIRLKTALMSHAKGVLNAVADLGNTNPRCVDQVGFSALLPGIVNAVGVVAGGLGGTIVGAASEIISSALRIFQGQKAKRALNELIRYRNQKVLACTYYATLNLSCEYERGRKLSDDFPAIKRHVDHTSVEERIYSATKTVNATSRDRALYETWTRLSERITEFSDVFDFVGSAGSSLLTDLGQIFEYFKAKIIDPDALNFPKLPPNPTPADQQSWLNALNVRGLYIPDTRDGNLPIPLPERVQIAIERIKTLLAIIQSAEAQFEKNKNFTNLRNTLERKTALRKDIADAVFLLKEFSQDGSSVSVAAKSRGPLFASLRIIGALDDFMSIEVMKEADFDLYNIACTTKGGALFTAMTYDSIGSISRQVLLALGSKSTEGLRTALATIRNHLLFRDLGLPEADRFSTFLRERALVSYVTQNYADFKGTGPVYRDEDARKYFSTFESVFRKEIRTSLSYALVTGDTRIDGVEGVTADHLCALYSGSLGNMKEKDKKLLARCRESHVSIELPSIEGTKRFTIDYADKCTYAKYIRARNLELSLLRLKLGI